MIHPLWKAIDGKLVQEGQVSVLGKNPIDFSKADRGKISYLIQSFVLYPELTAWENLSFAASFYGVTLFRGRRLNKLLDFVELKQDNCRTCLAGTAGCQKQACRYQYHDPLFRHS